MLGLIGYKNLFFRLLSLVSTLGPMLNSMAKSMGGMLVTLQIQLSSIVKNLEFLAEKGFDLEKFLTNSTALQAFLEKMWSSNTVDSSIEMTVKYMITPQVGVPQTLH
jgi:hypothetical protein